MTIQVTRPYFDIGSRHWPFEIFDLADDTVAQDLITAGVAIPYTPPSVKDLMRPKENIFHGPLATDNTNKDTGPATSSDGGSIRA